MKMRNLRKRVWFLSFFLTLATAPPASLTLAFRQVESRASFGPSRAVVALPNEKGTVTVAWRLHVSDPEKVSFHVYRRDVYESPRFIRLTSSPVTESTTYVDAAVRNGKSYRYRVHALIEGREVPSSDTAYVTSTDWHRPYISISLARPSRNSTKNGSVITASPKYSWLNQLQVWGQRNGLQVKGVATALHPTAQPLRGLASAELRRQTASHFGSFLG